VTDDIYAFVANSLLTRDKSELANVTTR